MMKMLILLVPVFLCSCPVVGEFSETGIDPTEYVYDITGTGNLVMADNSVRLVTSVLANSSWPDFHVPSSFSSAYRVYVYFEESPLCLYLTLVYDDGWRVKESSGNSYAHIGYGPYPDGFINALPYWMQAEALKITTDPDDPTILKGISFTCDDIDAYQPTVEGYVGEIKSVSVSLTFSEPLGYGAVNMVSTRTVDEVRFMDTRARLAAVTTEIEAGLVSDPVTCAPELTRVLTEGLTDPLEKVRVIHDWIAANIYYDRWWYETYYVPNPAGDNDAYVSKSPCAVLKTKKTVCGGYSLLLWYLCRLEGLHVEVVRGWVRSLSAPSTRADHTWNILRVNGNLYHIDTNADSANTYTKDKQWVPGDFNSEWFCPHLSYSHSGVIPMRRHIGIRNSLKPGMPFTLRHCPLALCVQVPT